VETLTVVYLTLLCHVCHAGVKMPQVEAFLTELYHGKPKACDLARFTGKIRSTFGARGEGQECHVTLDDIRSTMAQLKQEVSYSVWPVLVVQSCLKSYPDSCLIITVEVKDVAA